MIKVSVASVFVFPPMGDGRYEDECIDQAFTLCQILILATVRHARASPYVYRGSSHFTAIGRFSLAELTEGSRGTLLMERRWRGRGGGVWSQLSAFIPPHLIRSITGLHSSEHVPPGFHRATSAF